MRRVSLFLTTLVLAALLLAACGGQATSTSLPSTSVPPVTVESTSTNAPTEAATEAPTSAPALTTTPNVPVTGANNPSRLSNLIGSAVCGMGGDQLGTVQDAVLDFDQTMVTYVIVDANGQTVAVPWTSFNMVSATGTGAGTGTGTGSGTGTGAGATSAPTEAATSAATEAATAAPTTSSGTGTGTGTTGQNCLSLTVSNDMLTNAPAFDQSTLPAKGQPAAGWDQSLSSYWQGGGTSGTGTTTTSTPSTTGTTGAGSTSTPSTGASSTATSTTGSGTGTGTGQGAQQLQGVMLATDVLGATVMFSPQGAGTSGTSGVAVSTATSSASGAVTSSTDTPSASGAGTSATATTTTGTGTGTGTSSQGTVQDLIIEPQTGDMQYLVIQAGDNTNWIPVPIGFLRWDATNNAFILMISPEALQNAPSFTSDQFPDTSTSGWDQQFSTFWQGQGTGGTGTGTGGVTETPTP